MGIRSMQGAQPEQKQNSKEQLSSCSKESIAVDGCWNLVCVQGLEQDEAGKGGRGKTTEGLQGIVILESFDCIE